MIYIFLVLFLVFVIFKNQENFDLGIGKSFGPYIPPQECTPENNCFRGSYSKSSIYQNMCQPIFTFLNRVKIPLRLDCLKILR